MLQLNRKKICNLIKKSFSYCMKKIPWNLKDVQMPSFDCFLGDICLRINFFFFCQIRFHLIDIENFGLMEAFYIFSRHCTSIVEFAPTYEWFSSLKISLDTLEFFSILSNFKNQKDTPWWNSSTVKGCFFSENSIGLKKICQITILNLNFWNYILFYVAKKAGKFKQRV